MTHHDLYTIDQITLIYEPRISLSKRPKVSSSFEAYQLLKANWSTQISLLEEFNILLLDNQAHVLGMTQISKGGLSSTPVDIRLAFITALNAKSTAMILAHNHPSGSLKPSSQDRSLTQVFVDAGKILNIKVLDHIILTPEDGVYYSFSDEGQIITV